MLGILRLQEQHIHSVAAPPQEIKQQVSNVTVSDVPERLREADWDDMVPRVRLWAHQFHRRYLARVRAAPSPDDLVQEAITKLFTGKRRLPDDVPLLTVLINNIQSDIWNFLTREGYTRKDSKGKSRKGGGRHVLLEDWMKMQDADAVPAATDMRNFTKKIRKLVASDVLVSKMVDLFFQDPLLRPRDLAEMLEVPVSDINKAQKRLKRKLKHLREERT